MEAGSTTAFDGYVAINATLCGARRTGWLRCLGNMQSSACVQSNNTCVDEMGAPLRFRTEFGLLLHLSHGTQNLSKRFYKARFEFVLFKPTRNSSFEGRWAYLTRSI